MEGKVIVVTGGFGELGQAVGMRAAALGAQVVLVDIAPAAPSLPVGDLAPYVCMPGVDLQVADVAASTLASVNAKLGRIDALANVAGAFRWQTVADGDTQTWDLLYGINVRTALNASRAVLPYMKHGEGAIVNVGANGALKATGGMGAYAASKSGVHRLTEAMAEELKPADIRVNAVLPSIIDTAANRGDMPNEDFSKWVTPQALARVIVFLMSSDADAITGALLPVVGRV